MKTATCAGRAPRTAASRRGAEHPCRGLCDSCCGWYSRASFGRHRRTEPATVARIGSAAGAGCGRLPRPARILRTSFPARVREEARETVPPHLRIAAGRLGDRGSDFGTAAATRRGRVQLAGGAEALLPEPLLLPGHAGGAMLTRLPPRPPLRVCAGQVRVLALREQVTRADMDRSRGRSPGGMAGCATLREDVTRPSEAMTPKTPKARPPCGLRTTRASRKRAFVIAQWAILWLLTGKIVPRRLEGRKSRTLV
jgi:hypothetical protein